MQMRSKPGLATMIVFGASVGASGAPHRGAIYEVVDLGIAPGLTASAAVDVNPSGRVVIGSWLQDAPDTHNTAEIWIDANGDGQIEPAERHNLGGLGGTETLPYAINATSHVVGWSEVGPGAVGAFRWTPGGGIAVLPGLPGGDAQAYDVNDAGFAVGRSRNLPLGQNGSRLRAVIWTPAGAVSDHSPLGATVHTQSIAINNEGHVLGGRVDNGGAWVMREGSTHFLGGSTTIVPTSLNDDCTASGYVFLSGVWRASRWVWNGASMQHISHQPLPGFTHGFGYAVNRDGIMVGYASGGESRAAMWSAGGDPIDLNSLIDPESGWVLRQARGINDDGVIVGFGDLHGQPYRAFMLRPSVEADTDGDGLLDAWEIDGIPYDDGAGGTAYYTLPGADPLRKNLYVELDLMAGLSFSDTSAEMVKFAFAAAPVPNPDGSTGITLHIDIDEANLPFVATWQTNGCWPLDFDAYRAAHFGTAAERATPAPFALLEAKAKAFRYSVGAERFGPQRIGGCGELPGDNFVFVAYKEDDAAAAVFMHELGHNLGLRHGGGDNVNGKPNYPSIMNYVMSYQYRWNFEYWTLDFSRAGAEEFSSLDESSLDETAGIGSGGGIYDHFYMPYGVNQVVGGSPQRRIRWVRLDGRPTDFGSSSGSGYQDDVTSASVAQDLNYVAQPPSDIGIPSTPSPGQVLHPHNDWARVAEGLALASTRGARGLVTEYPEDELTIEAIDWIDDHFPIAPPICPGDVDRDGDIDFADLNVVLAQFNTAGVQLAGDIDRDGFVGFADLNIVISAFNTSCAGGKGS